MSVVIRELNLKKKSSKIIVLFFQSLRSGHLIVTYEVALSIQRLIQNQGRELSEPTWDVILDILSGIADNNGTIFLFFDYQRLLNLYFNYYFYNKKKLH